MINRNLYMAVEFTFEGYPSVANFKMLKIPMFAICSRTARDEKYAQNGGIFVCLTAAEDYYLSPSPPSL